MFFFGVCILLDRWNLFNLWNCMRKPAFEFLLSYVIFESTSTKNIINRQQLLFTFQDMSMRKKAEFVGGGRYISPVCRYFRLSHKRISSQKCLSPHRHLSTTFWKQCTIMEKGSGYTDCHPLMIIKRKGHNYIFCFNFEKRLRVHGRWTLVQVAQMKCWHKCD